MTKSTKRTFLLFLIGAFVALFLLATSLSNLQLRPGTPFPGGGNSGEAVQNAIAFQPPRTYFLPILQGFLALVCLILMVYVPARMVALVDRKRIVRLVLALVILLLVVSVLPRLTPAQPGFSAGESSALATPPTYDYPVTPLGRPPQAIIWLVIAGVGLGCGLVLFIFIGRWRSPNKIEAGMLKEAEQAVNTLKAGGDLGNVIMRCYVQMSRTLQEEQGVERGETMTVREFEARLETLGFPATPVHQLTTLFEKVRYGIQPMKDLDEAMALESLNCIIQFCRRGKV